ncbi:hypothetical protein [Flavobacterium sp.]|uniref:hypothetical protein n=1 Tax=Flavobacterium sp. TaxID=239 RepID=UPI002635905E|nr:hypothetical protein [Flavobacterium sp.]
MKKMLFGLIATVMISSVSFGQKITEESQKNIINSQMVSIVNGAKVFYTKGQNYNDFLAAMSVPSPTFPNSSQEEFFKKVYGYVSDNTPDCEILKADNTVLSKFAIELSKNPKNQGTSLEGKKWWQILINTALNVLLDVVLPTNNQNIDLWP